MVLGILFFLGLGLIWLFLIGIKAHDRLANNIKIFKQQNLEDKKENEKNE